MAKKVILKDDNIEIMPITRGELVLDSSGQLAFHSLQFLATPSLPGLMSDKDKTKLDSLEKVIVEDKRVELVNTTTNASYRLLFSNSTDDETKTEGARKSAKLQFNPSTGALTATTLIGKLDWSNLNGVPEDFTPTQHIHNTSEITALLNYSKADSASDLVATDTLNTALGKIEYKADIAYDFYTSITGTNNDEIINKWEEIVDFVDGVKEGSDITDEFVTRKSNLEVTGKKTFINNDGTYFRFGNNGVRLIGSGEYGYLQLGLIVDSTKTHRGKITGISAQTLTSLDIASLTSTFSGTVTATKFIGPLNNTLTFSAGTFAGTTYNNSGATTVNIPTHTSHLINNSEFLTSRGFIGTTAVLADSASQSLTGIVDISMAGKINFSADPSDTVWIGATTETSGAKSFLDFHISDDATDSFRWQTTLYKEGGNVSFTMMQLSGSNSGSATLTLTGNMTASGAVTANKFVSGNGINDFTAGTVKLDVLNIPTTSGGTTFGPGSNGQILKSNGTTVYWASDNNSWRNIQVNGTQIAGTGTNTYALNFVSDAGITIAGTSGSSSKANSITITNSGVRSVTIGTGDNARKVAVNTNGTTSYLTIPYATESRYLQCLDTRSTSIVPSSYSAGLSVDFKSKSITGLTAAYSGVITFRPYSNNSDWSGGPIHNLAFDGNGIHHRTAVSDTWGSWCDILTTNNSSVTGDGGSTWGSSITVMINGVSKTLTIPSNPASSYFTAFDNIDTTANPQSIYATIGGITKYLKVNYAQNASILNNLSSSNPNTAYIDTDLAWYTLGSTSSGATSYAGTNVGFPVSNNANGILWLGTHSNIYGGQLGISSNGRVYYRFTSGGSFSTTANGGSWNKIAWTSEIPTSLKNPYTLTFSAGTFAAKTYNGSAAVTVNIPTHTSHLTNNSGFLTLHQSLANYVTLNTDLTITGLKTFESNSSTTGVSIKLKNKGWTANMSTAMDFYNGSSYTVPNARIETKMVGDGKAGGTLIFYTQTKHASTNPNTNGLAERLRIDDNGLTTITGNLNVTVSIIGTLKNTLTFSAGAFSAKTYNNSAATTVNIPTHTSHLTNNSGFLTSRGYIGTTAVQASSASLALTGITTISTSSTITAGGNITAPHFYESSDIMLKTNIKTIDSYDNIPILKEFDWKEDGSHSYGLIAQELEEQGYSELVRVKEDGYKTVNYSAALSLIVGKLQAKIKDLEKEIENLRNKN